MVKYIGKRILTSILTIWVVITLTFFLIRMMPGGPFNTDKMTPEIKANLNAKYGLDKPIGEQYTIYMKNLLKGDFGESMIFKGRQVKNTIKYSAPKSAKVGAVAILVSLAVGVCLGIISALNAGKWPDRLCMILATLGITIPSFVIGAVLIYIFTVKLKLLPATGLSSWKNYVMPVIALSLSSMAFITRLTRSKLIDVLKSDYIRTAKAKGLSGRTVIFKHALRNSLIPIVTYLGPLVAGVLTGSFVIEKIFLIPGLGNEFTLTVLNRDYSALLGVLVFYSTLIVVANLIVDILYVIIDPRIKLEG
ncbi:ABC transporter permease [Clostridium chauvoei]|uniref:ABC transporter permease n=2 Tax=Clostridium chauvoei TaxID=46867 RepID=A0ABD4REE8_9CLOT|nr:ABC transporter permease [Clostridium chauvoei]ATD55291.1 peptide ABC transporter permease [Clostridium chauvoei]ATD57036.1 peptide ABC transporter permease [Clostridium chauvoei]MBX7279643.1 ABC transporter permease [Clostridium chauvoei]MBX7282012.1 ABC transporter permease [Clostridium chauvoei]MBX7284399.1 ABC transporter permease [Clostridium chauvoei]